MKNSIKTFMHSGNLGDIIYSLPTIIMSGGGRLYIDNGSNFRLRDIQHPNPMTDTMISQIIELLRLQPYLADVRKYNNEPIDYDLNVFRYNPFLAGEHISMSHLKAFNLKYDLGRKWLMNIEPYHISDIVINHTGRYVNCHNRLEYEALNEFKDRCIFIGFEQEHQEFMKYSGMNIRRYFIKSIVEFAQIIKGSKIYIGNQSLGFAMAEAMKTPRILEACCFNANCLPQSLNGHLKMDRRLLTAMLKNRRPLVVSTVLDNKLARIRNFLSFRLKERKIKDQDA